MGDAVTGSDDETLRVWDLESGEELRRLKGHTDAVNAVALTSDGRRAVSGASFDTLRVWDLETGEELMALEVDADTINAVALTQDGRRAVVAS